MRINLMLRACARRALIFALLHAARILARRRMLITRRTLKRAVTRRALTAYTPTSRKIAAAGHRKNNRSVAQAATRQIGVSKWHERQYQ